MLQTWTSSPEAESWIRLLLGLSLDARFLRRDAVLAWQDDLQSA